jgi:vancomycin resistance protein YoaR
VASTLYAALLSAGIDKSSITRLAHKIPVEYIEPGLDAWISGNGGELKFSNTLGHKLAVFAEMEDERFVVRIAGNAEDKKQELALKIDIVERSSPPVMNVENSSLKKGEKVVQDPGREGIRVNVYRGGELIGTDTYAAVKKIIQIGPGTEWSDNVDVK